MCEGDGFVECVSIGQQRGRGHNAFEMGVHDGAICATRHSKVVGIYDQPFHGISLTRRFYHEPVCRTGGVSRVAKWFRRAGGKLRIRFEGPGSVVIKRMRPFRAAARIGRLRSFAAQKRLAQDDT